MKHADLSAAPDFSLYQRLNRPYYIVVDESCCGSAHLRAAQFLCHALNLKGEEAWLIGCKSAVGLRNPLLTLEVERLHRESELLPILVCTESVVGNPFEDATRVCIALSGPLSTEQVAEAELIFTASENWLPTGFATNHIAIPQLDPAAFLPSQSVNQPQRQGTVCYAENWPDGPERHADQIADALRITPMWPSSRNELIALLRGAQRLYCFGNSTIALEAALCGCPVVLITSPIDPGLPPFWRDHRCGISLSFDPSEIEQAAVSVANVEARYLAFIAKFEADLSSFIAKTQQLRKPTTAATIHEEVPRSFIEQWAISCAIRSAIPPLNYLSWRSKKTLQEIDAQLLAERMVRQWPHHPVFHIVMRVFRGEEHLLADTLDSLVRQLYTHWRLTIIADFPSQDPLFEEIETLHWLSIDQGPSFHEALDAVLQTISSDWVTFVEPGIRLEPHALVVCGDYIAINPQWRVIYTDEDQVNAAGCLSNPLFKPDFNLDLLRSMHYLGGLCLFKRDDLLAAGGFGDIEHAEVYDSAWRMFERSNEAVFGHISEMLCHTPLAPLRAIDPEAERQALANHLARLSIQADIRSGHGFATRRIVYRHSDHPLVSIVIPVRNGAQYLRPCLETLCDRTQWANYEVLLIDNDSDDPDTLLLLKTLSQPQGAGQIRVSSFPGEFNYSALCNYAFNQARGQYLLFLDSDTIIVQESWLELLMASAQRQEVAIVAPRLAYPGTGKIQSTGLVLGLRGLLSTPYDNLLEPDGPGYMGLATLDRIVSVVARPCWLIRRSDFTLVGGMDDSLPTYGGLPDLCLKLRNSGRLIAWTPYVTVVHYGGGSRPRLTPDQLAQQNRRALAERDSLIDRWLPQLANDPNYNRHLSLNVPYQLDRQVVVDWDVNFHDRPRLLGFPVSGGSGEYRVIAPFRAISRMGHAQTCLVLPDRRDQRILSLIELARAEPDAIVFHNATGSAITEAMRVYAKHYPNALRILGLDDLITALPDKHPQYKRRSIDAYPRLREMLAHCQRLVVSTAPLADHCRGMVDDIRIMPNCLEWDIWGKVAPIFSPGVRPRVGWIGAQQHYGDLLHVFDTVKKLANEVDWVFMGMCPNEIRPYVKEYHDWVSGLEAYSSKMATLNLDLAIAPLDVNPFNEAKSNLRLLEYGIMGWPVVCTDIYPYRDAPVMRVGNTSEEWIEAIRQHLADRSASRKQGSSLRQWVMDNFILEKRVEDWYEVFTVDKEIELDHGHP